MWRADHRQTSARSSARHSLPLAQDFSKVCASTRMPTCVPRGTECEKKTIPPGSEVTEIPNPVEKDKAKQKQNRNSQRDDNRHERSRTL